MFTPMLTYSQVNSATCSDSFALSLLSGCRINFHGGHLKSLVFVTVAKKTVGRFSVVILLL